MLKARNFNIKMQAVSISHCHTWDQKPSLSLAKIIWNLGLGNTFRIQSIFPFRLL